MNQCTHKVIPPLHAVLQKGAQVCKARAGRTRTKKQGRRINWNCTTWMLKHCSRASFFFSFFHRLLNLQKNNFFFSFCLLDAVQTTRASWRPPSTSMICHREKYASRDKTSQLGLLLVFEQVHCAELGIKGTDRPQQLAKDSKYCP